MKIKITVIFVFVFSISAYAHMQNEKETQSIELPVKDRINEKPSFQLPMFRLERKFRQDKLREHPLP
ncbi:MAG: hypothetical protein AAF487_11805 [Bacteroidota bacterium]